MKNNRLSIYVSSPDSYADVFEVFYKGFIKFWADCPYEFVLTTNTQTYKGINCICNNKLGDTWIERTLSAISAIKSKYILLMCDDLIICDNVKNQDVELVLDYMDNHNVKYCRLNPIQYGDDCECNLLKKVNKKTPYAINLQIAIIRIDFFKEMLGDGSLSAWDLENKYLKESAMAQNENFEDVVTVCKPIIPFIHGVYKGKWSKGAVKAIRKRGIEITTKRDFVPYATEVKRKIIGTIQYNCSPRTRVFLKKVMKVLGMKFSTEA